MINTIVMNYFLAFFVLLFSVTSNAQQKSKEQFVLKGTMLNQKEGWMYLSYADKDGKYVRDSNQISNGHFQFMGFVKEPTMANLNGKMASRSMDDPNTTSFFLEPADMKITVSVNDFKRARITGSKTQMEYEVLQKPLNKLRDQWKVVFDTLSAVNKRSNAQFQELKNWVLTPYHAEESKIYSAFLNSHPTSYVAPLVLRFLAADLSTENLVLHYNRFPQLVKNSSFGKSIKQELERRKIGVPGTMAASFVTTDINGIKLGLVDYKGKYVLLDFWASWCVPCRKGNPHLLSLYAKYKDKGLEIIGVSDDDRNHEAWNKAVEQDKIGVWKHVLRGFDMDKRLKDEKNENDISEHFGISSLPTKILVDPNGMIIGRYGEGEADDKAMDIKFSELFGG
jgi:thiol-disulfide isomerase/thioredoxin